MFPRPLLLFGALLLASVAVVTVSGSDSLGPSLLFGHLLPRRHASRAVPAQPDSSTIVTDYVNQVADHFDSTNTATFKQRYFCNTGYANGSAIYILYVEDWGTATSDRVGDASQPHVATAKDLGATVCSLEHRYFGQSSPSPTSNSVGDMALMTSEQAVEDISTAIAALNSKFGESAAKWVLVGASYGGSLALWHRELHPDVTVGVVGSGAPINPAADFYRYQKNVEDAYNAFDPTCLANLASGVKEVRHAVQTIAGRKNLSDALQLYPSFDTLTLDYNDFQFFYAVLGAVFSTPVMYNRVNYGPFTTGAGLADVCAVLNDPSTANDGVSRIVNATQYLVTNVTGSAYGGIPNSYDQVVQALQAENGNDFRVTFYQMCSELGWFPTTDYGNYGVFGSQVPSNLWLDMCADVFGGPAVRNATTLAAGVNTTHAYFNTSTSYNGSNALLTLGEWDPWKTLGAVACADLSSDCSVAVVAQGAHVAETYPVSSADSDSLTAVRQQIRDSIRRWTATVTTTVGSSKRKAGHKKHRKPRRHSRVEIQKTPDASATPPEEPKIKNWNTKINYNIPDRAPRPTQSKSRFPFRPHAHRRTNFNRFHEELLKRVGKDAGPETKKSTTTHNSITQDLDHFDPSVNATWTQYYYTNNAYYQDGGPNFLMLGGEGPISKWDVSSSLAMGQWGQQYNAMLYSVEHRFYGESQPFDDLSTEHLKWLTSQQALADAAVFINQINTDRNLTSPVWVVFGGSYPGNLAAWFRLKYPQLMVGSIASSAPVQAKTDFYEYLLVVENSTRAFGTGGCADNVQAFSTWLQNQTTTVAGRTAVAQGFNLCGDWSADWVGEKDLEMVLSVTIGAMAGYVQYDDDAHGRLAQACGQFSSSSGSSSSSSSGWDAAEEDSPGYATISRIMQLYKETNPEAPAGRCNDYSYADYVDYMQNLGPDDGDDAAMRGWIWQTCNEFGFFQSTDRGYNIFESANPVNFDIDFCADVFSPQFTRDAIDANVRATNAYYGGAYAYNGTNVVFPNGSEDPWHALSVYNPINVNVTSVLIDGTSHCYDMYADDDSDTDALTAGRAQIKAVLDSWLGN